jgi:hypothetical protein
MRFIDNKNKEVLIRKVKFMDSVSNFKYQGVKGDFYFIKSKGTYLMFAFNGNGKRVFDQEDIEVLRKDIKIALVCCMILLPVSIALCIFLIGFLLVPLNIFLIMRLVKDLTNTSPEKLRNYLKTNMFYA